MATLTLLALGGANPGFWYYAFATVVGGYIDAAYIAPAIAGSPGSVNQQGPKVTAFDLSLAHEGAPLPWYIGPRNKGPGVMLWSSKFEEVVTTESAGGKGGSGGGGSITTFTYFVNLLIALHDGEISEMVKLFGDGKKILELTPKWQRFSRNVTFTDASNNAMNIDIVGTRFRNIVVGATLEVVQSFQSNNNGIFKVLGVKRLSAKGVLPESWRCRVKNPNAVDSPAGAPVWLVQRGVERGAGRADDVVVFKGTNDQDKWDVLEADEGTDVTPAFRNIACVGLDRLALNDFGERIPNFTAEIAQADATTVQQAITRVMLGADFVTADFDVTRVRGNMRGMRSEGYVTSSSRIQPIMNAFGLRVRESNGVFIFFEKGNEDVVVVGSNQLLSREPRFRIEHKSKRNLPSQIAVNFVDNNHKFEPGMQTYDNPLAPVPNLETVEIPVTLRANDARRIARDIMWERWNETKEVNLVLPPRFLDVEETDILTVIEGGETYSARVVEITRGRNMELEIRAVIEADTISDKTDCLDVDDTGDDDEDPPIPVPADLALVVLDIPAINANDVDKAGYWLGASPYDATASYRGASIYQSSAASGQPWNLRRSIRSFTIMGEAVTKLGPAATNNLPVVPAAWSDTNEVLGGIVGRPTVDIFRGNLRTRTADEVLEGFNNALLGNEIIGFQEPEALTQPDRYKLHKLLRGLRGTREFMDKHVVGERFVLLDAIGLRWIDKFAGAIGQAKFFKAVPSGGLVADFDQAETYQTDDGLFQANTLKPFAPTDAVFNRVTDTITWEFVTRQFTSALVEGEPPLDEEEIYELDVYNNTDRTTVLHTYKTTATAGRSSTIVVNGDGTSTFVYASGDQSSDGWSTFYARVYQVHKNYGRGSYEEIF